MKNQQTFNIRETAETLVPDKLGRTSYLLVTLMILLMSIGIGTIWTRIPPTIPLFFTLPWGEARLAARVMIWLLPGISLLFMILNLSLGKLAGKLSPLLPRVLAVSTAVIVSMMFIAGIGIVQSLVL